MSRMITLPHASYRKIVHQLQAAGCSLSCKQNSIDLDVARMSTCSACRRRGLNYEAWRNDNPRIYYAVAVCPDCGYAYEF